MRKRLDIIACLKIENDKIIIPKQNILKTRKFSIFKGLKTQDDQCIFYSRKCLIYDDRPVSCEYYPCGDLTKCKGIYNLTQTDLEIDKIYQFRIKQNELITRLLLPSMNNMIENATKSIKKRHLKKIIRGVR